MAHHCSLCREPESKHSSTFSPFYQPMIHDRTHRLFVGHHAFTEDCLSALKTHYADDASLTAGVPPSQRSAVSKAKICHCQRCEWARERLVLEQRVLRGDEEAVQEFVECEST